MAVTRSSLGRGPAKITWSSGTFWTRDDLVPRHAPVWEPVMTSMYGEIDKAKTDLVIPLSLRLWGAWENLSQLFPSAITTPVIGASVYGTSDLPLVVLARNGDQITYHNVQLTKVVDLFLGVDSELFAADVVFTALLADNKAPEDAAAYYTVATGQSYTDNQFAKTNFKRVRVTAAWGAITGFTAIVPQKGFNVGWELDLKPVKVDGYGTVDMTMGGLVGTCKCIPIQPTLAQLESACKAVSVAHGGLLSASGGDLVITGSGLSVTLKNAGMTEHGYAFGVEPLRVGEVGWATTRAFAAGVPAAVAEVS